jgi:DNA primase
MKMTEDNNQDFYKRVLENVDIVETIKKYVPLEGANGSYLEGPCPFNKGCGKSFCVSPERKTYFCFGCFVKGNVIDFIARIAPMNKITAARFLDNIQKSKGWEVKVEMPPKPADLE